MDRFDQVRSAGELLAQRVCSLIIQAVDVNDLAQQVDLDELIEKVDVNALLRRIDLDALVEHVDMDAMMSRVDLDAMLGRVDLDRLISRIDMDAIIRHTDIGAILALSSGHLASDAVDVVRGQVVALDHWIDRLVGRLLRRKGIGPAGPAGLLDAEAGT